MPRKKKNQKLKKNLQKKEGRKLRKNFPKKEKL